MQPIPNTLTVTPARKRPGLRRLDILTMPAAILACAASWRREVTR
jgi:hypothetical protein